MSRKCTQTSLAPAAVQVLEVRRLLSTVIVNTLADETVANSTTSLREAIQLAGAGDTVSFAAALTGTITLGGSELVIAKNLALAGPGAKTITISGNNASRVLRIGAGATVSISGLTLRDGGGESEGGGIYNAGSLTLNNCVVANNTARGTDAAVNQEAEAGQGGGIYSSGTLLVQNSTFTSNSAAGGEGNPNDEGSVPGTGGDARGGAIYNTGPLSILKGTFTSNAATGAHGNWSYFTFEEAEPGGSAAGGAIYTAGDSSVAIDQSAFSNSTARGGNAVTAWVGARPAGDASGGALYAAGRGQVTLLSSTFSNNKVIGGTGGPTELTTAGVGRGGAVYATAAVAASGGKFFGNKATGGGGSEEYPAGAGADAMGGAVWSDAALSFRGVTFDGNRAVGGEGRDGEYHGFYWTMQGGIATGGAMYSSNASAVLDVCTFSNNQAFGGTSAGDAAAGAVFSGGGAAARLAVTSSSFISNRAQAAPEITALWEPRVHGGARGGAIVAEGGFAISGSTLQTNTAIAGSGAVGDDSSWMGEVPDHPVPGDPGGDASGGAIWLQATAPSSIARSTLYGNSAVGGAGGDTPAGVSSLLLVGNGGDAHGGGVYLAGGSLTMTAATLAGNQANYGLRGQGAAGGAEGDASGSGVKVASGALAIGNTIVATNNQWTTMPDDISGTVTSHGFNLIGTANGSTGWVASDKKGTSASPLAPKLAPLANNGGPTKTMALLAGSPALDAGKSFGLTFDQRGSTRPRNLSSVPNAPGGDGSDIGAFELQALAPMPVQTPFKSVVVGGTPVTIQSEDFDNGGENVAYHDLDAVNTGGAYRSTGVDIQATVDAGGGFNVGWAKAGEWLEYTVTVQATGKYDLAFRVASNGAGGRFHLEVDGQDLTGPLTVPNTYGWQEWKTITRTGVNLTAGKHVLRLALDSNGPTNTVGNFNYLTVTRSATMVASTAAAHVRDGSYRFTNFGTSPVLEVKRSSTNYNREAYLKFDLSSVASISSAKLRLFGGLADTLTPSVQLGIYSAAETEWTETGITWDTKPLTSPTAVGTMTISGPTKKWYEIDVTGFLKAQKAAGRNAVTLVLRSNTFTSTLCNFNSDEAAENRPLLVVGT